MNTPIVNLSSHTPNKNELQVLSRGLKFVPSSNPDPLTNLDVESFIKTMNTQYMFKNRPTPKPAFFTKYSNWTPEPANHPEILKFYSALVQYCNEPHPTLNQINLSKGEEKGLSSLMNNHNLVIKPSDKGNGIVLMDKTYYIGRTLEHLSDESLYQPTPFDKTPFVAEQICLYLAHLKSTNQIDPSILRHLYPPHPLRTPLIYILPKTNKPDI